MSIPPTLTQCNPNKIPANYFVDIDKLILKFIWRVIRPRIANTILKEKSKFGGLMHLDFKTYYKALVIKTVCIGKRIDNRSVGQSREARNRSS